MPPFTNIPGVDGKKYTSDQFKEPILIIVFSCNHCPYVQAYEERMKTLQRDYAAKGVRLIAINANEIENYRAALPESDCRVSAFMGQSPVPN